MKKELKDYLQPVLDCPCGREHQTALQDIRIGEGTLKELPGLVGKYGCRHIFVVGDVHTWQAAGNRVEQILKEAGMEFGRYVFEAEKLVPDEAALGRLITAVEPDCDLLIGVGSGTINDLCKYVSYKMRMSYIIVATAPSMDGFTSNVAALITERMKTTYEVHTPLAVIGDVDVLKEAPMEMLSAGVGDILGKYVCLTDWKLSHLLQGEYHCSEVEEMVRESIRQVAENIGGITRREPGAVKKLMEALTLSGIAMSYVGNSRPASGSEHHLSHYWEMMYLFEGRSPVLHGTKVGIGTVAALHLYRMLGDVELDAHSESTQAEAFSVETWEREIRRVYGPAAEGVIQLESQVHKNAPEQVITRVNAMEEKWHQIRCLIAELPSPEDVAKLLREAGAPTVPSEIGVDDGMLRDSIIYAKELRNRYGLLQVLFDLGLAGSFADRLVQLYRGGEQGC